MNQPTDLPRGDRRTVRVVGITIPQARPGTVEAVLLAAARVIARNGVHHGDYVEDAFSRREPAVPLFVRPMSVVGAIRYAATGSPQKSSQLADMAVNFLALSLPDAPLWRDLLSLESHVEDWSDDLSAAEVVAGLELTATAPERAA